MIKVVLFLLIAIPFHSHSSGNYLFAGLMWGDSFSTVSQKLQRQGFTRSCGYNFFTDRFNSLQCEYFDKCFECRFRKEGITAEVRFQDRKLDYIWVHLRRSGESGYAEASRIYGTPTHTLARHPYKSYTIPYTNVPRNPTYIWIAPNQTSIMAHENEIEYRSQAATRSLFDRINRHNQNIDRSLF